MHSRFLHSLTAATVLTSLVTLGSAAFASSITFDVANSSHFKGSIPPTYETSPTRIATATPLISRNLSIPNFSDLEGDGKFWFGGWTPGEPNPNSPGFEFSVTAVTSIRPGHLKYTFFSGNWSDLWLGPSVLSVWGSTNNFETSVLIARHTLRITNPTDLTGGNFFDDDCSVLGTLTPGQTVAVRFVGSYEGSSRPETPAGFSKRTDADSNLILEVQPLAPVTEAKLYAGITVTGTIGEIVTVQYTTDLTETGPWQTLKSITLTDPSTIVIDYDSVGSPKRLYRVAKE